jgi:hypothetical protein
MDLYYIRRGVVHNGHFQNKKSTFDRVMSTLANSPFRAPNGAIINVAPGTTLGGVDAKDLRMSGKILMMEVESFCKAIMDATRAWIISKSNDPTVQKNFPMLVRYRPDGLPPFMVGAPIIA